MTALDTAIDARLQSDATLVGLLGTHRGQPNIFFDEPLPPGVEGNYIDVPAIAQTPFDTKNGNGRAIVRDINCFTAASGDTTTIEAMGERIRALFHRHQLSINGFQTMIAVASGPSKAETDKTLYGRTVTLSLTVWET